jgi:hypothetical protein
MDNVQNCDSYLNMLSSQTYESYLENTVALLTTFDMLIQAYFENLPFYPLKLALTSGPYSSLADQGHGVITISYYTLKITAL